MSNASHEFDAVKIAIVEYFEVANTVYVWEEWKMKVSDHGISRDRNSIVDCTMYPLNLL